MRDPFSPAVSSSAVNLFRDGITDHANGPIGVEHIHASGVGASKDEVVAYAPPILLGRRGRRSVHVVVETDVHVFIVARVGARGVVIRAEILLAGKVGVAGSVCDIGNPDSTPFEDDAG
jgi:hypothetical protein